MATADTSKTDEQFSQSILGIVDSRDANAVRKIFHLLTMGGVSMYVPKICRDDKSLCCEVLDQRVNEVNGIRGWCKAHLGQDGRIDWVKYGPYVLHWDSEGKAKEVEFVWDKKHQ